MFELSVLITTAAINLLLGLVVYLKNPRSWTNRLFFLLAGSFAGWSTVNYLSLHPPSLLSQLTWIRLVLFFAGLLCLSVFLTFQVFPSRGFSGGARLRKLAIYSTACVMALTLTPLVFKSLSQIDGSTHPNPGPGIILFALLIVSLLGCGVSTLVKRYHRSEGQQKSQLRLVLWGLAGAFGLIVITDFLLVVVFQYTKLVPLGPAYTLIFSGALAYAIIKHRLFDIRAAIARTVAYTLVIGTLVIVYVVGLFGVINVLFTGPEWETLRQLLSVALVTPLAISFQKIKGYFDRLTNKIFYRDAYDTQEVLDELGNLLVAEINLGRIITGTHNILVGAIQSSFIEFVLVEDNRPMQSSTKPSVAGTDTEGLIKTISSQHKEIIIRDELGVDNPLRQPFVEEGISLSLKLKTQQKVVGYILVGDKRSGYIYSNQDTQLLAIVADEVAIAIQNALRFKEIQQFNITLQRKVEEATHELRRVNARLRQLDKTKDEFISMASHQLRTPLTTVKGYLSMVLEGDVGKVTKAEKEYIQKAFDGAQKMVYLIADLLNVSRLQSGKFVIEDQPTKLAELVGSEIGQLEGAAKERQITLVYHKPEESPVLNLDETKIRQVVMNFLDNALYYTPAGGTVTAELSSTDKEVSFSVTDTGIGVPASLQHHLFSKFYRADNARKARPDGTGLGLFMAKKVIAAQGGAIIFRSTEGKGSTFGFSFPRNATEVKEEPTPVVKSGAKKELAPAK